MVKKTGGNLRTIGIVSAIGIAVVAVALLGIWIFTPPAPASTLGTGQFSIELVDGKTADVLNNNDFDYVLWGVDDDPLDFVGYTEIESASGVGSVGAGDLDGYDFYIIRVNGTVTEDFYDDGGADRTYYNRYFILTEDVKNSLTVYQEPSAAGFGLFNLETFAVLDLPTANVTYATNFTIIASGNSSQVGSAHAAYVEGPNYENEVDDAPNFVIQANDTFALSDLSISGCEKSRVNSTSIRYSFIEIGPIPTAFYAKWSGDAVLAEDLEIITVQMNFGDTELDIQTGLP